MGSKDVLRPIFGKEFPEIQAAIEAGSYPNLHEELRRLRTTWFEDRLDPLTRIFTRGTWFALLRGMVKEALERKVLLAVLFSDLSFLNMANDAGGHTEGDLLLRGVGNIANGFVHANVIFGRYGGDEITGVMSGMPLEDAFALASNLRAAVKRLEIKTLMRRGFSPGIDVGIATLAETEAYLKGRMPTSGREYERNVATTLVQLADHRSAYMKCVLRLELLANLLIYNPQMYEAEIAWLAKGANNPTKDEVRLIASLLRGNNREQVMAETRRLALRGAEEDPVKAYALRAYVAKLKS